MRYLFGRRFSSETSVRLRNTGFTKIFLCKNISCNLAPLFRYFHIVHLKYYLITLTQVGTSNSVKVEFNVNGYTSGTQNLTDFSKLTLSPNPVGDHFTLGGVPSEVKQIAVSNLEGRRLCHFEMTAAGYFEIPDFEPGTYLISLENEQGRPLKAIPMQKF